MTRGPVPKRSEERRRRNTTTSSGASNEPEKLVVDPADMDDTSMVPAPTPDPRWHPLALMQYEAAKRSAIRELFEPTDWAQLFVLCDQLSQHLNEHPIGIIQQGPQAGEVIMGVEPMNGATLGAILKGFSSLLFTEGDRRRLRIEVERQAGAAKRPKAPTGENVVAFRQSRLTS